MSEKICSTEGCENQARKGRSKCQPCLTAQHNAWRQKNIEQARAYESQYRAANADKLKEYEKKPERRDKQNARRRERLRTDPVFREKNRLRAAAAYAKHSQDPEWRQKQNLKKKEKRTPEIRLKELLRSRYKLSREEFDEMVARQNGLCAICGQVPGGAQHRLSIDHCHKTGKVRELLCRYCNHLVSILEDKQDLVLKASMYITRHARTE